MNEDSVIAPVVIAHKRRKRPEFSPSPGPWSILHDPASPLIIIGGDNLISGISVARLLSRNTGRLLSELQEANALLLVAAVNACFAVNPNNPRSAARAYPALAHALQDFLLLSDDPNIPAQKLKGRAEAALKQAEGGGL